MKKHYLIIAIALLSVLACSSPGSRLSDYNISIYNPKYATGFEILGADGVESTLLKVLSPWQDSSSEANQRLVFIRRNGEIVPKGFDGTVIESNADRIICMSSSHVAMLNVLGEIDKVVGVSGVKFLCNERASQIKEVGYDQNTDFETIIGLEPDVVLLYGIAGPSPLETKLRSLNIPYAYIGEYLEESPIGKAEWLVAMAEIAGCRDVGEDVFFEIPARYNAVKEKITRFATSRPKVMLNIPYGDSWFMPGCGSYIARLIEDASGEYVYKADSTNRSRPLSLEEAVVMTSQADFWLNAHATTLDDLKTVCPKCADLDCVTAGRVYNCDRRSSVCGGNDFWESGVVMPDVVLYDLGVILHPGFGTDLYFYRQLQ